MSFCFGVWQANSLLQHIWKGTLMFLVGMNAFPIWFNFLWKTALTIHIPLYFLIFFKCLSILFKPKLSNPNHLLLLQVVVCLFSLFALQPYIFIFKRRDVSEEKHDEIEGEHDGSEGEHETSVTIASKPVTSSSKKGKGVNFISFF